MSNGNINALRSDIAYALNPWVSKGRAIFLRELWPAINGLSTRYQEVLVGANEMRRLYPRGIASDKIRARQRGIRDSLRLETLDYLKTQGYQPGHFFDLLGYGYGWGKPDYPHASLLEW